MMRAEIVLKNYDCLKCLPATALAQNSIKSEAISIGMAKGFSASIRLSGSPVGTFKLQLSNDFNEILDVQENTWDDISNTTVNIIAATQWTWTVIDAYYRYIRVVWTRTSGTGQIKAFNLTSKS